jgi:hypothetical protein
VRVSSKPLALAAAIVVLLVILALSDDGASRGARAQGGIAAPSPQPTAAAPLPGAPAADPEALAADVDHAEAILHSPSSSVPALQGAGRYEQLAVRLLDRAGSSFRRAVFAALGDEGRAAMRADTGAAAALSALVPAQRRLPRWRIVAPPPPGTLLGYYKAGQARSGVPWPYLAAIEFVETKFGRVVGLSTAGARGPMQFMPATWARYGRGDIGDQRDSILGAARFLAANGAPADMGGALFHYNPSRAYVRAVQDYAAEMRDDPQSFLGYYHWQVLYRRAGGTVILPEGYPRVRPLPLPAAVR